jgi:arsenite methyltransferase
MNANQPPWWQTPPDFSGSRSGEIFRTQQPIGEPFTSSMPISRQADPMQTAALHEAAEYFANADYLTAIYDQNAHGVVELYDALVVPQWSRPFGELIISQLLVTPRPSGAQVLDVACGTGYPTLDIVRYLGQDADVAGIDNWPSAIECARHKANEEWLRNITFLEGDIAHAPLPEDHFDLLTCNLGYTSFADRGRALAVMARVIRSGGWLLLTTPLQTAFREFLDLYHTVLSELQLMTSVDALVALVKGRPTVATTRAAIERTGMTIEREVVERFQLHFVDGKDFLTSPIVALNFMVGWRAVVADIALRRIIFNEIERRLDARAQAEHGLTFEIPMLCLSARRITR